MAQTIVPLSQLTAISPLDGRYGQQTAALRDVFSEFAFMRERLRVEVEWLIRLSKLGLPEMPPLAGAALERLRAMVTGFSLADCEQIKAIEARTNHDVKAV
jgi:adenylosuccinate lyase